MIRIKLGNIQIGYGLKEVDIDNTLLKNELKDIILIVSISYVNFSMSDLLQKDLGSSLLSITVLLGWLGIGFVFLRILTISIKRILEAVLKLSNKK